MASFTVHVPPGIADPIRRAERTIFVRDGFSLRACLFGAAYLVYHRLWASLAVWLVMAAALTAVARLLELPVPEGLALYGVLALLTGLEAGPARQRAYRRRGYLGVGLVEAQRREAAEHRFFAAQRPDLVVPVPPAPPSGPAHPQSGPVIGLFPKPGGFA